jgi:hypothetical protein
MVAVWRRVFCWREEFVRGAVEAGDAGRCSVEEFGLDDVLSGLDCPWEASLRCLGDVGSKSVANVRVRAPEHSNSSSWAFVRELGILVMVLVDADCRQNFGAVA